MIDDCRIAALEPPSTGTLARQLAFLRGYADLRADRLAEILEQQGDIISFFGGAALLNAGHRRRSLELLETAQSLVIAVCAEIKHLCWSPRPVDFDPRVYPVIQTPDHSTYPSGHATEAFALATVLHRLMTGEGPAAGASEGAACFRIAHRIAVNRTIAGVHFPVDSAAGAMLGCALGEALHALATGEPGMAVSFTPGTGEEADDFGPTEDFTSAWLAGALGSARSVTGLAPEPAWALAWRRAAAEWGTEGR